VRIDRLELRGSWREDRRALASGLEAGLRALLASPAAHEALSASRQVGSVKAGGFRIAADARPRAVGRQLARAVFAGVVR
jgi:hypothetical protein